MVSCHILSTDEDTVKFCDGEGRGRDRGREGEGRFDVVCWLLKVPATCKCISRTDLLRQY